MRHVRSHSRGFALTELLIAIAIFGIVMLVAYSAIGGSLRVQADQEAVTTAQGKLRRVMEVLTQDLRSAVFGSITAEPYLPAADQVSFMMLSGGAGYTVLPPSSLPGFPGSQQLRVQMPAAADLPGRQVVMINNASGLGVVLPVTSVTDEGDGVWRLHSSCRNTIAYELNNMLLFEVSTIGLRYDADEQMVMLAEAGGDEVPFAFGLNEFRIEYVYRDEDGGVEVLDTPHLNANGVPPRSYEEDGELKTLSRIQFVAGAEAVSRGNTRQHMYSGQVELSRAEHFKVEEIVPCN